MHSRLRCISFYSRHVRSIQTNIDHNKATALLEPQPFVIPSHVDILVTDSDADITRVCRDILNKTETLKPSLMGFSCEWPHHHGMNKMGKLKDLYTNKLPDPLIDILCSPFIHKIGLRGAYRSKLLFTHYPRNWPSPHAQGMIDLYHFAHEKGIKCSKRLPLASITSKVLQKRIPKDSTLGIRFQDQTLTQDQNISYCNDNGIASLDKDEEFDRRKGMLDIYIPDKEQPLPYKDVLLVYIHGGAWRTGDKEEFVYMGQHFATLGIPTAIINYRLSNTPRQHRHPIHIQDCAKALHFLYHQGHQYYGFQPRRLYLVGHSAGAQLTGLLTLCPGYLGQLQGGEAVYAAISGVVGVEGIYDIPLLIETFPSYSDFIDQGFTLDTNIWKQASPQYHSISTLLPPYLILYSHQDELVDEAQSSRYHQHLLTMHSTFLPQLRTDMLGKHDEMLKEKVFFNAIIEFIQSTSNKN